MFVVDHFQDVVGKPEYEELDPKTMVVIQRALAREMAARQRSAAAAAIPAVGT